jgi:hypothetical protein
MTELEYRRIGSDYYVAEGETETDRRDGQVGKEWVVIRIWRHGNENERFDWTYEIRLREGGEKEKVNMGRGETFEDAKEQVREAMAKGFIMYLCDPKLRGMLHPHQWLVRGTDG